MDRKRSDVNSDMNSDVTRECTSESKRIKLTGVEAAPATTVAHVQASDGLSDPSCALTMCAQLLPTIERVASAHPDLACITPAAVSLSGVGVTGRTRLLCCDPLCPS